MKSTKSSEKKIVIKLNEKEYELIRKAVEEYITENGEKIELQKYIRKDEHGNIVLEFNENDDVDGELWDACIGLLQIIGFDENYEPTEEGWILERLIDKLYR